MNRKALVAMAALALAATGTAMAQPDVYDAHGRLVGEYEANQPSFSGTPTLAEIAIRDVAGVQVALQVTSMGFVDTQGIQTAEAGISPSVFFSGQNCEGEAYLAPTFDAEASPTSIVRPIAPLVQDATTVAGVAYYLNPSVYTGALAQGSPVTVCSALYSYPQPDGASGVCQVLGRGACITRSGLAPATALTLSTLNLTPPFSVK